MYSFLSNQGDLCTELFYRYKTMTHIAVHNKPDIFIDKKTKKLPNDFFVFSVQFLIVCYSSWALFPQNVSPYILKKIIVNKSFPSFIELPIIILIFSLSLPFLITSKMLFSVSISLSFTHYTKMLHKLQYVFLVNVPFFATFLAKFLLRRSAKIARNCTVLSDCFFFRYQSPGIPLFFHRIMHTVHFVIIANCIIEIFRKFYYVMF